MSLVRVWTDIGARKPVPLLAKIVEKDGAIFTIRYLSESDDKIWRYEEDTYEIDSDSIAEELGTDLETDLGFRPFDEGFMKCDSDDDYVPTSSEDETSSDEELTDEDDEDEGDDASDEDLYDDEEDSDGEEYVDDE
jgi:hypothetical protein